MLADTEEVENGDYLGREGDSGAGQEFADEDFYRVEPEELLWFRAKRDTPTLSWLVRDWGRGGGWYVLVKVALTEAP